MRGWSCHYIESATRVETPSLTGRLLSGVPGVHTYSQSEAARWKGWRFRGSVFDGFRVAHSGTRGFRRVLVSVGTDVYPFPRLIQKLMDVLPRDAEVLWQVGTNTLHPSLGIVKPMLSAHEFEAAVREADVVVSHAGTGSALAALDAGKIPVLVPRQKRHGECVDDHQLQLAGELHRRGLALSVGLDDLTTESLERVAGLRAEKVESAPPFLLDVVA
jgi:UDP-N-acetylglucosamine--N-acetylmuramyl-(pentapeptide) pyrophosphoryl-undecaprenol N-acetylglucosamine transferase